MEHNRGSWGSNTGFLLAAIGSAVGLGNIWSFPYKMGRCGGFLFFILYLLLSVFVGFVIMAGELAMGRKTGRGAVGAYHALSKRFRWVGWLAVFSPFVVMGFYAVLGGYCMEYMVLNLSHLVIPGMQSQRGAEAFQMILSHPMRSLISMLAFMAVCYLISRSGVSGGIERFNKVGMPALFGMLAIMIVRSLSLPNAMEGLKFMFLPGYAVEAGFIQQAPGFASILATAGGQMFFSLSLAMGAMITYGSYLGKGENLAKNAGIIVTADAIVATLAGVAVIPAAIANGIVEIRSGATVLDAATGLERAMTLADIQLGGPSLLFVTLQDVFRSMGAIGPLFGTIFYLLVLIAAISSAVSLMEVVIACFLDRSAERGKRGNRPAVVALVSLAIAAEGAVVAADGLGTNGLWVPFQKTFGVIGAFNGSWLEFMSAVSEGIAMPLGALLMSLMVAWELRPKALLEEIHLGGSQKIDGFFTVCIRFVVPLAMLLILVGQLDEIFHLRMFS